MKPRKTQWKKRQDEEKQFDLRVLAPNVMRMIVAKMSVEEHIAFRATCKYAHDVRLGAFRVSWCSGGALQSFRLALLKLAPFKSVDVISVPWRNLISFNFVA